MRFSWKASYSVMLGVLGVYLLTLAPTVYGLDSAELATGVYTLGIVHPTGYPLYLVLGKLFTFLPVGDVAYRLNLMSAVFGALTAAVVFQLGREFTRSTIPAAIGAGLLAFSVYFWQVAVVAEVYTLHTFLTALCLWLLKRWEHSGDMRALYGFALAYGLGLANHMSGILFAPAYLIFLLSHPRRPLSRLHNVMRMWLLWAAGIAVYSYLPLRQRAHPALDYVTTYYNVDLTTISGVWWMMSGQAYRFFSFGYPLSEIPAEIVRYGGFLWRDFLGVGVGLGVLGAYALVQRRRHRRWLLLLMLIYGANTVFFLNYAVIDKDTMFLPGYMVWALWSAVGVDWLFRRVVRWRPSSRLPLQIRLGLGRAIIALGVLLVILQVGLNWTWVDHRRDRSASVFAEKVLQATEPNALVMGQWSSAVILEYYQVVEGSRPDLLVFNRSRFSVAKYYQLWVQRLPRDDIISNVHKQEIALIDRESLRRPIYTIEYDPALASAYEYRPVGGLFRLERRD